MWDDQRRLHGVIGFSRHGLAHFFCRVAQVGGRLQRGQVACRGFEQLASGLDVGAFEAHHEGTLNPTVLAAFTMPCAITSQRMMPPKMLTRTPLTRLVGKDDA